MANITDQLADLAIIRSLLITRVANGMSRDVASMYNDILDDIDDAIKTASPINLRNMNITIRELKTRVDTDFTFLKDDMTELAKAEAVYTASSANAIVGATVFAKLPTDSSLANIYNTSLMQGATLGSWFSSLDKSMQTDLDRAVKLGVSIGEDNYTLAKRINNTLNTSVNHAKTIAITGANSVANQARMKTYEANDDVISKYQYLSVLDAKTSNFCKAYSNKLFDAQTKKPIGHTLPYREPPHNTHWRCRSSIIAVLKTFEELGIEGIDEIPKGTQSSIDGQVSADLSFNGWLKGKTKTEVNDILGKGRADLFLQGKITMSDLINQQGRTLTIAELKAKYN